MIRNIMFRMFMWLGRKLYTHQGKFKHGEAMVFSNIEKWSHKYGMSKWEMGILTPKQFIS